MSSLGAIVLGEYIFRVQEIWADKGAIHVNAVLDGPGVVRIHVDDMVRWHGADGSLITTHRLGKTKFFQEMGSLGIVERTIGLSNLDTLELTLDLEVVGKVTLEEAEARRLHEP